MGCASCFRQIAKNIEIQRKVRKERNKTFKRSHERQKSYQELRHVKFSAEEKEKLMARISIGIS